MSYTLSDKRYNALTKSLCKEINLAVQASPDNTVSLNWLRQQLSQSLFSMPHEEAVRTGRAVPRKAPPLPTGTLAETLARAIKAYAGWDASALSGDDVDELIGGMRTLHKLHGAIDIDALSAINDVVGCYHALCAQYPDKDALGNALGAAPVGQQATSFFPIASMVAYVKADAMPRPSEIAASLTLDFLQGLAAQNNTLLPREQAMTLRYFLLSVGYQPPTPDNPSPRQRSETLSQFEYYAQEVKVLLHATEQVASLWDGVREKIG